MDKQHIIQSFSALADALRQIPEELIHKANIKNPWFTPDFIKLAGMNWSEALQTDKVAQWLESFENRSEGSSCGIIMAGNIPFVGLQDLLCVLACGQTANIKFSSGDEILMKYVVDTLSNLFPEGTFQTDGNLKNISHLIATGSNNSARYFEYYFRNTKSLIRKSRTSVAVLSGKESSEELQLLADDIYTYFGLGCRNVSHLILPRNIELKNLYEALDKYMDHVNHHKYYNNYMYHKSIFLMNLDKHYDNGFMLFRENTNVYAPVATMNYHYYDELSEVNSYIEEHKEEWQCIVGDRNLINNAIPFGSTQKPELWDYADHVNIPDFLNS